MSGKLKESIILLEEMIAQLKIYMGRFEEKDMQTDSMYLEWQTQVMRMQGTVNYMRLLDRETKRRVSQ
jgi:hypothetical protein